MVYDSITYHKLGQEVCLSPAFRDAVLFKFDSSNVGGRFLVQSIFENNLLRADDITNIVAFNSLAWWFWGVLIACITTLVVFNIIFKGIIIDILIRVFSTESIPFRGSKKVLYAAILSVFSAMISLTVVFLNSEMDFIDKSIIPLMFIMFTASVFMFFLIRIVLMRLIGFLTNSKSLYDVVVDFSYCNMIIMSILLIVILSILGTGIGISSFKLIFTICGYFLVGLYIVKIGKVFYISLTNKEGSIVNLFLYLCTVELMPVLYLIGVAKLMVLNGL